MSSFKVWVWGRVSSCKKKKVNYKHVLEIIVRLVLDYCSEVNIVIKWVTWNFLVSQYIWKLCLYYSLLIVQ